MKQFYILTFCLGLISITLFAQQIEPLVASYHNLEVGGNLSLPSVEGINDYLKSSLISSSAVEISLEEVDIAIHGKITNLNHKYLLTLNITDFGKGREIAAYTEDFLSLSEYSFVVDSVLARIEGRSLIQEHTSITGDLQLDGVNLEETVLDQLVSLELDGSGEVQLESLELRGEGLQKLEISEIQLIFEGMDFSEDPNTERMAKVLNDSLVHCYILFNDASYVEAIEETQNFLNRFDNMFEEAQHTFREFQLKGEALILHSQQRIKLEEIRHELTLLADDETPDALENSWDKLEEYHHLLSDVWVDRIDAYQLKNDVVKIRSYYYNQYLRDQLRQLNATTSDLNGFSSFQESRLFSFWERMENVQDDVNEDWINSVDKNRFLQEAQTIGSYAYISYLQYQLNLQRQEAEKKSFTRVFTSYRQVDSESEDFLSVLIPESRQKARDLLSQTDHLITDHYLAWWITRLNQLVDSQNFLEAYSLLDQFKVEYPTSLTFFSDESRNKAEKLSSVTEKFIGEHYLDYGISQFNHLVEQQDYDGAYRTLKDVVDILENRPYFYLTGIELTNTFHSLHRLWGSTKKLITAQTEEFEFDMNYYAFQEDVNALRSTFENYQQLLLQSIHIEAFYKVLEGYYNQGGGFGLNLTTFGLEEKIDESQNYSNSENSIARILASEKKNLENQYSSTEEKLSVLEENLDQILAENSELALASRSLRRRRTTGIVSSTISVLASGACLYMMNEYINIYNQAQNTPDQVAAREGAELWGTLAGTGFGVAGGFGLFALTQGQGTLQEEISINEYSLGELKLSIAETKATLSLLNLKLEIYQE